MAAAPTNRISDAELEAAIAALSEPGRLADAEALVARTAPSLQRLLGESLAAAGWFDAAQRGEVEKAVAEPDPEERLRAVLTLLAEETRIGMLVGVSVGWALAERLASDPVLNPENDPEE